MQELTKEYLFLFNTITRTQQELQRLEEALLQAQRMAEELYLERTDDPAARHAKPFRGCEIPYGRAFAQAFSEAGLPSSRMASAASGKLRFHTLFFADRIP